MDTLEEIIIFKETFFYPWNMKNSLHKEIISYKYELIDSS